MGNATLIDKLKDDIAAGRVVVIAGTGVSVVASGNPKIAGHHVATWTGLLGHGIAHCTDRGTITPEVANHLTAQLRLGETDLLITAAETVSQRLRGQSPGTFRGWLKDSIGELKVQAPALIDALQALGGLIATLNYDTLIEQATGRRAVTWRQADAVTDVLRNTMPDAVLHLHGVYEEPESVVLGLASYLQVGDDAHASTVLRSLAQGRTLLFVGCGDTVSDPNFARLIEWAKAALDDVAPHHVFLCRQSERSAFQDRLRGAPWLQPLAYGDDYADLLPFLQTLAPAPLPAAVPTASPPATKPIHLPSHSLGALFLGRDELLAQLHAQLGSPPTGNHAPAALAVLHGLGGMGKTRLALEYAWRHADTHSALLLVDADSPEALQRKLAALAGPTRLDLPAQHETDEARQRAAVLQWLGTHPGWLLILDNADSEAAAAAVEALLPQLAGGHLIVTSRISQWSAGIPTLAVGTLPPEAAAHFLLLRTEGKRRPDPDAPAAAATLAAELDHLALALEQAGAHIARQRLSFGQYLEKWRQQQQAVLKWHDPRLMHYPASVATTWQTSFAQLQPPARALLERLAWLAPDPIPESLLEVPVPDLPTDEGDSAEALAELEAFSLVTRATDRPEFSVHRLVQAVTRHDLQEDGVPKRLMEALGWVAVASVGDPVDVRSWPILDPLAPHALAMAGFADEAGITMPTTLLLSRFGVLLHAKAAYPESEPLLRRALAIDENSHDPNHPIIAIHVSNLAQLLKATNHLAEAELLMRRALKIDEANYSTNHSRIADDLNSLAVLLKDTNRLTEAEPMLRRGLAIYEATLGPDHPRVANGLNNLAQALHVMGRLDEAEPLMSRALAIAETHSGLKHPMVAIQLNNLAMLLEATSRHAEAEPLLRRALAINETSYGSEHPSLSVVLNNLAQVLRGTNRLAEAEPLMLRALKIDMQNYGAKHPDVAICLNNLATLFHSTNRTTEAEPLLRQARSIFIQSLGTEHPYSREASANYLAVLQSLGKSPAEIQALMVPPTC